MNIIKTNTGFIINEIDYILDNFEIEDKIVSNEIISNNQVLIGTNQGIILLDLSCTINEIEFNDINLFIQDLLNL